MPEAVNQSQPERTQFRLRVAAIDRHLDQSLVELTEEESRPLLPTMLYLFSERLFILRSDDAIVSPYTRQAKFELLTGQFKAYRNSVEQGYRSSRFSVDRAPEINKPAAPHRVRLAVNLGITAGKVVLAHPFFDEKPNDTVLPVYYNVPHPMENIAKKIKGLYSDVGSQERQYVDELTVVNIDSQQARRPIKLRAGFDRTPPAPEVIEPTESEIPVSDIPIQITLDELAMLLPTGQGGRRTA